MISNNVKKNVSATSLELMPITRTSTGASTLTQADLEAQADTYAASRQTTSNRKKLAIAGAAGAVVLIASAVGIKLGITTNPSQRFTTDPIDGCGITPKWCDQLANFSWVVPNNPPTNYSSFYANFHNQPQNLTQQCLDLFGSNRTVPSPQPNAIQSFFGPFPILPGASAQLAFNGSRWLQKGYPTYPVIMKNNEQALLGNQTINYSGELC